MSATQKQIRDNAAYATFEQADKVIAQLRAEVTALRQAVNEARTVINESLDALELEGVGGGNVGEFCRAWLAAHPAPEQVTP